MEAISSEVKEKFQMWHFCVMAISHPCFSSKTDIRKFSTSVGGGFFKGTFIFDWVRVLMKREAK